VEANREVTKQITKGNSKVACVVETLTYLLHGADSFLSS